MQGLFNKIISYHDLINGDLVPDKINPANIAAYLNAEQLPCEDMIVGKFKGSKLIDIFKISSANPLAEKYYTRKKVVPHYLYFKLKYEQLTNQLANIKFDKLTLYVAPYYTIPVSMPVVSDWSKIESDRLRYCHINHLLNSMEVEHIYEIRNFSLINDDEQSKVKISKLHRLLNSFLIELANSFHLKSTDLELSIKKEYSIRDCAVLIYRSIVKVLDFTYDSFRRYMDFNLNIPYSSKLINNNNFISKANRLERKLQIIELDDSLKNILNEELEKIIKFQSLKSITYKEYDYYTMLFKALINFFLKKNNSELDQEKIVDFLIFINYKNEAFFEYVIKSIYSTANDFEDNNDKLEYLVNMKKEYSQLDIKVSLYSIDVDHQLVRNLLKWIEIELSHVELIPNTISNNKEGNKIRIKKLSLNVSLYVIVIFYRLLYDCGFINIKTKTELVKWIHDTHTNKNNIDFSPTSITNKMSNPKPQHLEKAENMLLKMLKKLKLL
jgi:hypothetical protein